MSELRPSDDPQRAWASLEEAPPPPPAYPPPSGSAPAPAFPPPPGYAPAPTYPPPPGYQPLTFAPPAAPPPFDPSGQPPAASGPSAGMVAVIGLLIGAAIIGAIALALGNDDEPAPLFVPPTTIVVPTTTVLDEPVVDEPVAPAPSPAPTPDPAPESGMPAGWVSVSSDADGHPVTWSMPEPNDVVAPRPAAGVQAISAYWIAGGSTRPIRHDVAVLTQVEPGLTADAAAFAAIRGVQTVAATIGDVRIVDGRVVVPFSGPYDGRMYEGVAYSWDGVVVLLSAAYYVVADRDQALQDLAAMEKSLTFGPP